MAERVPGMELLRDEPNGNVAPSEAPAPPPLGAGGGGFSAGKLLAERYWDFRPLGIDAHGHVPFPSHDRKETFYKEMDAVINDLRETAEKEKLTDTNAENLLERRDIFQRAFGAGKEQQERFLKAAAKLCNGSPNTEQLRKLPPDAFSNGSDGFFEWLLEITLPKTSGASGTG